jgi:hypothetical protein
MTETNDRDALEIGAAVHQSIAALLQNDEVVFSACPIDVMHQDGMRRAFVLVTLDEDVVDFLEHGLAEAIEQMRRRRGD